MADISPVKERATRLARIDGVEQIGSLIGTFLSPIIFNQFGYYGNYGFCLGLQSFAFIYIILRVR